MGVLRRIRYSAVQYILWDARIPNSGCQYIRLAAPKELATPFELPEASGSAVSLFQQGTQVDELQPCCCRSLSLSS